MNQMNEEYWKQLAENWIKNRTSIQHQQNESCQITNSSKNNINIHNPHNDDNSVTDMDIEDVKEEQQPVFNWPNSNIPQQLQQNPVIVNNLTQNFLPNRFQNQESKPFMPHHHPLPINIPEPPLITIPQNKHNNIEEQLHSIDMDMEESDNENDNDSNSSGNIDAQKKKTLPIWIREGLEKMRREKELENARIQEELKAKEDEEKRKKLMEEALKEIEQEKLRKSKYETSDSENDEREHNTPQEIEQLAQKSPQSNDENDEEDAYEKMMLLVRQTLTTILLETTNEKIQEISSETLSKYRKKASTSSTNKPSALLGLGLGVYSSSSDSENSDDEGGKDSANNSDWEPESVLKERIRQKAISFERRSKDIKEKLIRMSEREEEVFRKKLQKSEPLSPKIIPSKAIKKSKSDSSESENDKRPSFKGYKDGEEKYEQMIYSISASSAAGSRIKEKKTRFSDVKDRSTAHMTHVAMIDTRTIDNNSTSLNIIPSSPKMSSLNDALLKKEKVKKKKRSSSSSSDSSHRKKHKKHKKHSKKSSKKRDKSRSRSRSRERDRDKRHKSDRQSMESKTSVRSSESHRRSRSRSRERHRRRY